ISTFCVDVLIDADVHFGARRQRRRILRKCSKAEQQHYTESNTRCDSSHEIPPQIPQQTRVSSVFCCLLKMQSEAPECAKESCARAGAAALLARWRECSRLAAAKNF